MIFRLLSDKLQTLQNKLLEIESAVKQTDEKLTGIVESTHNLELLMINSGINLRSVSFPSCKDNLSKRSGKYILQLTENDQPFLGYCEQTAYGGGWLVFQYRYDGSVDFYRNWTEYRDGFGSVDGEFWLGLEHLHRMTSTRKHELLVELKDFEGNYKYTRYDEFEIGSEEDHYPLAKLGPYTGTAGDSLHRHKGMNFTTKDSDNDVWLEGNRAVTYQGAWWYYLYHTSNLNGIYNNSINAQNIVWDTFNQVNEGMAYSRMLIRAK
ncbi:fibrinogen C domain-containing protein 1 [Anopheles gambiae]|uniref:fibrinogen C domain-containing protein 1 n=1 Tax=Anopheles gambiae TaxID=7165 RepID=UPI002AC8D748|nr:fibrinogen C domain-containing protein 1 [Anopheles gambiae]